MCNNLTHGVWFAYKGNTDTNKSTPLLTKENVLKSENARSFKIGFISNGMFRRGNFLINLSSYIMCMMPHV